MNLHRYPTAIRAGLGLAGALALAGMITVVLAVGQGAYDHGYELRAVFPTSSQGLFTDGGSAVKLRGVNVGQVSGIELLDDGRALVRLFVEDGARVPDTAMASIEPLSIFGPKFVRIEPGDHESSGPFLGDGDRIPRTQTQRELTDILAATTNLFDHVDPLDIVAIVDAIAEGTSGMGPQIGRTIDASAALAGVAAAHADELRQFLADAAALTGTLSTHGTDVLAISDDVDELVSAALSDPDQLDQLLDTTAHISSTFAALLRDHRDDLDVTLRSVGSFIDGISVEADRIPELIDLLGTFFGGLADVIRFDGPGDTRMAGLRGFISLDLCLVYGVCVPAVTSSGEGAAAGGPSAPRPAADVLDARALRALRDAHPPSGPLVDLVDLLTGSPA